MIMRLQIVRLTSNGEDEAHAIYYFPRHDENRKPSYLAKKSV